MDNLSRILSRTLDQIGYNSEIIEFRRSYWSWLEKLCTSKEVFGHRFVYLGSKAEGISALFQSDIDQMRIINGIVCSENAQSGSKDAALHLETNTSLTPSGYTTLRLNYLQNDTIFSESSHFQAACLSMCKTDSGEIYAFSSLFLSALENTHNFQSSPKYFRFDFQGPAIPNSNGYLIHDDVCALSCKNVKILNSFKTRRRNKGWPSNDILQLGLTDDCQLVPVGCKGSSSKGIEWRFCFIETELKLTYSFNETQLKLYIVLKLIAQNILKNVTKEISSYIMKNVSYWMSERLDSNLFRDDKLFSLIIIGLKFLRFCIRSYNLPYYMIPERNLLYERLDPNTRQKLSLLLSTLIQEGPAFLFRIPKLDSGMTTLYQSPSALSVYSNKRNEIEKAVMLCMYIERFRFFRLYKGVAHYRSMMETIFTVFPDLPSEFTETAESFMEHIEHLAKSMDNNSLDDLPFKILQVFDRFAPLWRIVILLLS